jgi:elongation factor 1-gamma
VVPDFKLGESNKTPEYLTKFPHGKIPGLELDNGFTLFESWAIARYRKLFN